MNKLTNSKKINNFIKLFTHVVYPADPLQGFGVYVQEIVKDFALAVEYFEGREVYFWQDYWEDFYFHIELKTHFSFLLETSNCYIS